MVETQVIDASVDFVHRNLVSPLVLSTGTIESVIEARAHVQVDVGGSLGTGWGCVYLSDIWAWPDKSIHHERRQQAMIESCQCVAKNLSELVGGSAAHPLELGLRLAKSMDHVDIVPQMPRLAQILCASPFDAAIHDATGIALNCSAFHLYSQPQSIPLADHLFPNPAFSNTGLPVLGACQAIHGIIRQTPIREFPSWFILGPHDRMDKVLRQKVQTRGDYRFKLKIAGKDLADDADWTISAFRWLRENTAPPHEITDLKYIVDANEAFPDSASVKEYLERIRRQDPDAFAALWYLEQPTSRDTGQVDPQFKEVGLLKPLIADESLDGLDVLSDLERNGWSGIGLKTCKGHSLCLVAAAWAAQHNQIVTLQDLTNPGFALIHAALFGAYVPTMNGVELNSPQFTPAANRELLPHLAELVSPSSGRYRLPDKLPHGLGSVWGQPTTTCQPSRR